MPRDLSDSESLSMSLMVGHGSLPGNIRCTYALCSPEHSRPSPGNRWREVGCVSHGQANPPRGRSWVELQETSGKSASLGWLRWGYGAFGIKDDKDIDELLDPGGLSDIGDNGASICFRMMPSFCTNMVYGLQGIYGLTDATIKDARAPFLLLLWWVCVCFFPRRIFICPPKSHNWLYRCLIERNNYELRFVFFFQTFPFWIIYRLPSLMTSDFKILQN